ncbi:MAG: DUF4105 domain-containing protein [Elusimicrobiales bacterium]|nr:DUF4105 domain-containing protein [Elusimicrobiales bacterium]
MKKHALALAAITAFFSVSRAQDNTALDQLAGTSDINITIPEAPLPDRGPILDSIYNAWDPAAPFSYSQAPALALSYTGGVTVIKNVRSGPAPADHKSYAWDTLTIKTALIEKVVFGYRTYGVGHSFLVFVFRDGGAVNSLGKSVRALTFGAEGWSREPYGYTLAHALNGRYPLIWAATTFESYTGYIVAKKTDSFFKNMNLGPAQTARLFGLLMARIDETNRNKEMYNMFTNSCTNNPVNLINQVIPADKRIALEVIGVTNPNSALPRLAVRKYTNNGTLRTETFRMGADNYAQFDITKI